MSTFVCKNDLSLLWPGLHLPPLAESWSWSGDWVFADQLNCDAEQHSPLLAPLPCSHQERSGANTSSNTSFSTYRRVSNKLGCSLQNCWRPTTICLPSTKALKSINYLLIFFINRFKILFKLINLIWSKCVMYFCPLSLFYKTGVDGIMLRFLSVQRFKSNKNCEVHTDTCTGWVLICWHC